MRLIDADELKTLYDDAEFVGEKWHVPIHVILANIDDMPTVDPVKQGQWVEPANVDCYKCSICKKYATQEYGVNSVKFLEYCPHCGARMDEVKAMSDDKELIGKTIVYAEIGGYGLRLKFSDGSILDYSSSDGVYSSWEIIDDTEQSERSADETD